MSSWVCRICSSRSPIAGYLAFFECTCISSIRCHGYHIFHCLNKVNMSDIARPRATEPFVPLGRQLTSLQLTTIWRLIVTGSGMCSLSVLVLVTAVGNYLYTCLWTHRLIMPATFVFEGCQFSPRTTDYATIIREQHLIKEIQYQ